MANLSTSPNLTNTSDTPDGVHARERRAVNSSRGAAGAALLKVALRVDALEPEDGTLEVAGGVRCRATLAASEDVGGTASTGTLGDVGCSGRDTLSCVAIADVGRAKEVSTISRKGDQ